MILYQLWKAHRLVNLVTIIMMTTYQTGEQNVTLGFNVQMLTTAGTIANTGPPPTCAMRIVAFNGEEINSAEIGDNLRLQVEVQPASKCHAIFLSCF